MSVSLASMRQRHTSHERPSGQTLVLFALFLVVLLGAAALVVDYGSWLLAKRGYQNVTDAAALAGVAQLSRPLSDQCFGTKTKADCAREAAWTSLKQQLGLTALNPATQSTSNTAAGTPYPEAGYRVWVDTPPTAANTADLTKYTGAYSSDRTLLVRVERDNPSYLGNILGLGDKTVSGWSTAGLLPNRWALLGLCPKGDSTCNFAQDIWVAGTGTGIKVINGDVGSNWSLKVTSGTGPGVVAPDDSQVYLVDYDKCASATWNCPPVVTGGIQDGATPVAAAKAALPMRPMALDPNFPLPAWIDDATAVPDRGTFTGGTAINSTDAVDPTTGTVHCDGSAARLGPGSYDQIKVNKGCVVLDPTLGLTPGQRPGIFRIRSLLNTGNDAFIIGDGVSIFFDSASKFSVGTGGGVVMNTGNAGFANRYKGAWTTSGQTPWPGVAPLTGSYAGTYSSSVDGNAMTFYIRRPAAGVTSVWQAEGNFGIQFRGVAYGPKDTMVVGGNSNQNSAGQIIGWTIKYNGTTTLNLTYEGPADERPYLLEPTLGQ